MIRKSDYKQHLADEIARIGRERIERAKAEIRERARKGLIDISDLKNKEFDLLTRNGCPKNVGFFHEHTFSKKRMKQTGRLEEKAPEGSVAYDIGEPANPTQSRLGWVAIQYYKIKES